MIEVIYDPHMPKNKVLAMPNRKVIRQKQREARIESAILGNDQPERDFQNWLRQNMFLIEVGK